MSAAPMPAHTEPSSKKPTKGQGYAYRVAVWLGGALIN